MKWLRVIVMISAVLTKPAVAQYPISFREEVDNGARQFIWTINIVQSNPANWPGLLGIVFPIDNHIHLKGYSVPSPPSDESNRTFWLFQMEYGPIFIAGYHILGIPPQGQRWLLVSAAYPAGQYPVGTTLTFSLTTDLNVQAAPSQGFQLAWIDSQIFSLTSPVIVPSLLVPEPSGFFLILFAFAFIVFKWRR